MSHRDRFSKKSVRNVIVLIVVIVSLFALIFADYQVFFQVSRARPKRHPTEGGNPTNKASSSTYGEGMEEDHILFTDPENMPSHCRLSSQDSLSLPSGNVLLEKTNLSYSFNIELMRPQYMQLCLAKHTHQHRVDIKLSSFHDHDPHQCELYLSTESIRPSSHSWDWKIDPHVSSPSISLFTYLPEFRKSTAIAGALFIGLHRRQKVSEGKVQCHVEFSIHKIENEALLAKTRLRGGQILLPRDVADLFERKGIQGA